MVLSNRKRNEASELLKNYSGCNSHIIYLKSKQNLNDYDLEYILMNHMRAEPIRIDRLIKITDYYGKELQNKNNISFAPTKLYIKTLTGETDNIYHVWCKWAQNQEKWVSLFIPKRAILDTMIEINWKSYHVDVDRLNNMLKGCGREIQPHQIDAIKFGVMNNKCIIGDDMGLTKTSSSISITVLSECKKVLIICPASIKSNWVNELSYYGITDVGIIDGTNQELYDLSNKYIICNYDIFDGNLHAVAYDEIIDQYTGKLKKVKSRNKNKIAETMSNNPLISAGFDMVILDEVHRLSNTTSNRYKAVLDFIRKSNINRILLLTGTIITNDHTNLYSVLQLIDAEITKDWNYYMEHFCGARKMILKTGKTILRPTIDKNGEELKEKIKHLYIRRTKDEIEGLPVQHIFEKRFDLTNEQRTEYERLWNEYEQQKIEEGVVSEDTVSDLNKKLVSGGIYRQYLAKCMTTYTIELAEEFIFHNSKVVIMCWYLEEVNLLSEHFGDKCVVYKGGMTQKQKDKAQEEFNNNPAIDVLIGNIISAGLGVNLVSTVENRPSNCLILNSFDYVPANNQQAVDRIRRFGVKWDVNIYYLMFNQTHSAYMFDKVLKKNMVIDTVIKEEKYK
jgi:SWI/SNF-related matrix-associated actin-dependent regulator 1 of chromatin subfamily A